MFDRMVTEIVETMVSGRTFGQNALFIKNDFPLSRMQIWAFKQGLPDDWKHLSWREYENENNDTFL